MIPSVCQSSSKVALRRHLARQVTDKPAATEVKRVRALPEEDVWNISISGIFLIERGRAIGHNVAFP